jgi:hypothetical protein
MELGLFSLIMAIIYRDSLIMVDAMDGEDISVQMAVIIKEI